MDDVTDLVNWLREQFDTDERLVERNSGEKGLGEDGSFPDYRTYDGEDLAAADAYLAEFNPKRMRAEVDANRRILDWAIEFMEGDYAPWNETCIQLLALPYADRPGYREEWKP